MFDPLSSVEVDGCRTALWTWNLMNFSRFGFFNYIQNKVGSIKTLSTNYTFRGSFHARNISKITDGCVYDNMYPVRALHFEGNFFNYLFHKLCHGELNISYGSVDSNISWIRKNIISVTWLQPSSGHFCLQNIFCIFDEFQEHNGNEQINFQFVKENKHRWNWMQNVERRTQQVCVKNHRNNCY